MRLMLRPKGKVLRSWVLLMLAGFVMIGCTYNVGNHEPYRSVVGKTVYLKVPQALFLPVSYNIKYSSFPYLLEKADYYPFAHTATQGDVPDGTIFAVLPVGTPLHIQKVKKLDEFDNVQIDALGTVYVPSQQKVVHFAYTWTFLGFGFPLDGNSPSVPWTLQPPTTSQIHAADGHTLPICF